MRLFLLVLVLCPCVTAASQWQALSEIRELAEEFAASMNTETSSRTVQAGTLDSRLRLKNCVGQLEGFLPPGTRPGVNMTVGVRCTGATPWRVFVPVRSRMTGLVLVSRHALARGHSLSSTDVELAKRDLDRLPYGYLTDPRAISGRVLRRPVTPGAVIIPPMLGLAQTVRRGQTVTLYADRAGVRIRAAGKALSDGALQQRIRVQNLSSGRVIEGIVRSEERVEILMN
ncbi:MAG: flagellar basal body P-ring formation chaperone FlgA [Gammaproteobacteria bacterium]|nr:flagellar basal body P-ring formation chaperone FlgA [Gammaproteobacteria bacterium]